MVNTHQYKASWRYSKRQEGLGPLSGADWPHLALPDATWLPATSLIHSKCKKHTPKLPPPLISSRFMIKGPNEASCGLWESPCIWWCSNGQNLVHTHTLHHIGGHLLGPYFRVQCASHISPWISSWYASTEQDYIKTILFINNRENTLQSSCLHSLGHWPYNIHLSSNTAVLRSRGSIPTGNSECGRKPYP
jgi:hypothetical protein